MALIKCPECGNEISDKAKHCIHCGFPLEELLQEKETIKHNVICINEKEFDLTNVIELMDKDLSKALELIREMSRGLNRAEGKQLRKSIDAAMKNKSQNNSNITVKCPYCHSKDTFKISNFTRAAALYVLGTVGSVEASKQWHCNNCGSDF